MTQKGFDLDHIKLIRKLNKGEINFAQYLDRRGLSKNGTLEELRYIVNDNPLLFNEFLSNISIGLRCRAMKGIFRLTNRDLNHITDFGKSSVGYFINENMEHNKDSEIVAQRNTSIELICDLAIIYDLPFKYLANTYTKYEMNYEFVEYNTPDIEVKNLYRLIEDTLFKLKNESEKKRSIYGVKIVNDFFQAGEKKYINTRVDIREKFFTIELHLENYANINSLEILSLENSLGLRSDIFIRDAFLRDNKKLCILISIEEELNSNVSYLSKDFLWRNVLFNLKKETLKKLENESISPYF